MQRAALHTVHYHSDGPKMTVLLVATLACGSTPASPSPTEPAYRWAPLRQSPPVTTFLRLGPDVLVVPE